MFTIIEGWKYLPHSLSGWYELCSKSIGRFSELGVLLVCAFMSSRLLTKLNLGTEFSAILDSLNAAPIVIMLVICIVITLMVGPFNATATTTAMGAIVYTALRSIGLSPVVAAVAFYLRSDKK
ncbi:MAG: TRAP transporter large permease subunit [Lachnospiraceae bacterium]|nr:TRAP transporter large permease subunit [Lachnospiraceae bacterium]